MIMDYYHVRRYYGLAICEGVFTKLIRSSRSATSRTLGCDSLIHFSTPLRPIKVKGGKGDYEM